MQTKIKPILFNNWSVERLIRGAKTQTRRKVNNIEKPPFEAGMVLWVREAFRIKQLENEELEYIYSTHEHSLGEDFSNLSGWKPSIHLPRNKSRILLKVTSIHYQLLQDISKEDVQKEGISSGNKELYFAVWEDINGIGSVAENPVVWVIEFEVLSTDLQTTQNLLKEFADGMEQN